MNKYYLNIQSGTWYKVINIFLKFDIKYILKIHMQTKNTFTSSKCKIKYPKFLEPYLLAFHFCKISAAFCKFSSFYKNTH